MMLSFTFYPLLFGYNYEYFPLFVLAILAPLLSLLILITPKKAENLQKIFFIYGIYTFAVFLIELYWSIENLPSIITDYYYSPMAFTFGTPLDPALFAGLVILFTLFFSVQFLRASKSTLEDPFDKWSSESIYGYGFLILACFLAIIIILILRS